MNRSLKSKAISGFTSLEGKVKKSPLTGFTLIEILVVVGIIAVLASVIAVNAIESGKLSRDAKRQSDLRALQNAIELYKNRHGRYPEGCRPANSWSGQQGTAYQCASNDSRYILGADGRWFNEFMVALPQDKKLNGSNSGYIYMTNSEGTVYKLKAQRTVESEVVDYLHEFKACDIRVASTPGGSLSNGSTDREVIGWCGRVHYSGNSLPAACNSTTPEWNASYAVWGGFAPTQGTDSPVGASTVFVRNTTDIICR